MKHSRKRYTRIQYQISHKTRLLFIATNPSPGSYRRGIPFSSNKSFWYLLQEAGLLSENYEDLRNDRKLKKIFTDKFVEIYNLGLINIIDRPTRTVAEVTQQEAIPGVKRISRAVQKYHPAVICFVGKGTYQLFTQTLSCDYGWQQPIGISKVFVMHSPLRGWGHIRIKELQEVGNVARLLD